LRLNDNETQSQLGVFWWKKSKAYKLQIKVDTMQGKYCCKFFALNSNDYYLFFNENESQSQLAKSST